MVQRTHERRRGGFTLIELLVVVAIIAILASLTAVAVFGFLGGQSKKNTNLVLQKTDNALQQQWSEVAQAAKNDTIPVSVTALAGGDTERARVIWMKLKLRQNFPMSYAEALYPYAVNGVAIILPGDLPPIEDYKKRLNNGTLTKANDPNTEMAACLLMALSRPRKGKKFNPEESLGANAIKDTDGDGVAEIVDGWGKAVGFYRWGTGNTDLDAQSRATNILNHDTQDPFMRLMDSKWNPNDPGVAKFQALCHPITASGKPRSFFTIPVIVSAGTDGSFGIRWPDMYPLDNTAADNIYSFKVR